MKTSFEILKRDLLALLKNPIALLVVGALLVLPGLYAWYCIVANWDPYSNTGSMPIAIVNEDAGASNDLAGEINIGKQVIDQVAENDKIDWKIYDNREEALEDTRAGIVYATIVFPEDLSKNVVGILEGSKEDPVIEYFPNEKYNAVATKVCDGAAQTLVRQINQNFSSTVNKKVLEKIQEASGKVEEAADATNRSAIAEIESVQQDLDRVIASLDDATVTIEGWRDAARGADNALAATNERLPDIVAKLDQASYELDALREKTDGFEGQLSASIMKSTSAVSDMSSRAATTLNNATADLKAVRADLEAVENSATGDSDGRLWLAAEGLDLLITLIQGIVDGVDQRVAEMNQNVQVMTGTAQSVLTDIAGNIMPQFSTGARSLTVSLSKLSGAVNQFEPEIAGLRGVLDETDTALAMATDSIADAKGLLSVMSGNLRSTVEDVGAIGKALEVEKLSKLLNVSPDNVGTFISSPVHLVTEKINPVSNYGTAVAPFYTNLALWVGCFILVSLMKVEVMGFPGATPRQRYFGRLLLFVILSLLQSQVICGVDILLGIDCQNPGLFMLAGAVCSFAYMNLIYALVKTFRNIGKTLCIFLLIMQVPGSSGMYPIQIMPGFFQFYHPLLPFTYGIDAMREALCGMYGMAYVFDLIMLLLIVPGSLLVGLGLRRIMTNLLLMFDEEMNKVGFFATEHYAEGYEKEGVRGMMRALIAHGRYADDIEERAIRFRRVYPRWRKALCVAVFVVPFAVLVLMLPFNVMLNLETDVKLAVLILMLIVLFIIQISLIVLEYTHRSIAEEARLLGESLLDGLDLDLLRSNDDSDSEAEPASESGESGTPGMVPATEGLNARDTKGGPTRDIFFTDIRLGFHSVIGVVVIVLLVITPSMYAWFNIAGSWDPYSATGNLEVAVANEDQGYKGDILPMTINIGDTLVSQLRGNSNFDWVFVDSKDEAIKGVESSKYYAAIVIPEDFSSNMLTYLTDDAAYPDVVYYTNEKENPIAPIITQKGADSIQENIRVSFTERVDQVVLGIAYDVLDYVKDPRRSDYVSKMSGHLDDATRDAKNSAVQMRSLGSLTRTTSGIVSTLGATIEGLQAAGDSAKEAIADAKAGADSSSAAFDQAVVAARELMQGNNLDFTRVKEVIDKAVELLQNGANAVPESIDARIAKFEDLLADPDVSEAAKAKARLLIADLQRARQNAATAAVNIADAQTTTETVVNDAKADIAATRDYFETTVAPSVDSLRLSLSSITETTSDIVGGLEDAVAGIGDSTGGLSNQLETLSNGLMKAGDKLESTAVRVDDIKARVADALKSGNLQQIEDIILGSDTETMAMSLAAPLKLDRQPMFAVSNFGSAMAPFYTVLSLWVGALVMISTMRVHVVQERMEELRRRYVKVRPRHEFFGRYGIFGLIGFLQSSLVLLGDLFLLHIQCVNPVMFFILGTFIGQMFCLIVFAITELFGDVGKALCVILLIMQVAASGGTFPVEMLHPILLNVSGFLPFYYAMRLLQECVAGVTWPYVLICGCALLVMAGALLIIALPLRKPFRKLNNFFEEQLEKTGYM